MSRIFAAIMRQIKGMFSATPPPPTETEQHWSDYAQALPRGPFIMWLANEVATELICDNPRHLSIDRMISNVDHDAIGLMQHDAERFLHHQYTRCDPTQQRRIIIFRHLIQQRLKFSR